MRHIYKFEAMTTDCEVILITPEKSRADECAKAILKEAKRLEKRYSYYDENSILAQINRRELTKLDSETETILRRAILYAKKSEGVFDITIGTLKKLYMKGDSEMLHVEGASLSHYVGVGHIKIKKGHISFDNPHTIIDLGGFVKELAVDNAVSIVKKFKIGSALINFGGDMYALGRNEYGKKFTIAIKDPDDPKANIHYIQIEDEALTTSASYERSYQVGDETYSHILTPKPSKLALKSATVVAKTCVESGVFSTALMIDPELQIPHKHFLVH